MTLILLFSVPLLFWCGLDTPLKVCAELKDEPPWTLQDLISHLLLCCVLQLYLACRFLSVNTGVNPPGWRLANWHFTRVTQEWWSRDESSCLDFKSSSLTPGPLCLWAEQKSTLLSCNMILPEDCISNSFLFLYNKPFHPGKTLLLHPQYLTLTSSASSCVPAVALQFSPVLKIKSVTGTGKYEVTCDPFFK